MVKFAFTFCFFGPRISNGIEIAEDKSMNIARMGSYQREGPLKKAVSSEACKVTLPNAAELPHL